MITDKENNGMATIELKKLDLNELQQLRKDVDTAILNYTERRKAEALVAVAATAKEFGFNLAELVIGQKRPKARVAPKYANPNNLSQTWSGRGRQPKWVGEALAAGKRIDDLTI